MPYTNGRIFFVLIVFCICCCCNYLSLYVWCNLYVCWKCCETATNCTFMEVNIVCYGCCWCRSCSWYRKQTTTGGALGVPTARKATCQPTMSKRLSRRLCRKLSSGRWRFPRKWRWKKLESAESCRRRRLACVVHHLVWTDFFLSIFSCLTVATDREGQQHCYHFWPSLQ